ncbi:DUF2867 domain-containing protein [uncultured Roseibium sp.]|uniref:DUF2867 domain-containing protein n=1 Tax=uncultured Roseibium sp. TaxID=1936171 RepID=UPI0026140304|nr:DUF2867 domain-containing protein [uncultured Roseibium sp.]
MSKSDELPEESLLHAYIASGDYLDVFSVSLEGRTDLQTADMRVVADHMLNADIGWMKSLLAMRDKMAAPLGMKTTADLARDQRAGPVSERHAGDRIGFFKVYDIREEEIVLGENDWHQDFRLSIFRTSGDRPRIFAATCCKRHNAFGYLYLALILPFHRKIVTTVLDTAVGSPVRGVQMPGLAP